MHSKEYYIQLRNKYIPDIIKVIFLLESPPISGNYFYNPNGKTNELLFSAMMEYIKLKPKNKEEGLIKFRECGLLIIDSILEPVNKIQNKRIRNKKIVMNIPNLINELDKYIKSNRTKIVLVKRNINQIFLGTLSSIGYKVIDLNIPFPDRFHRNEFLKNLNKLK